MAKIDNLKGHKFPKVTGGNPKGRPVDKYKKLLKDLNLPIYAHLTKNEKYRLIEGLLELDKKGLFAISQDDNVPAFIQITAKAVHSALITMEPTMDTLELIYNRIFGKATQQLNIESKPTEITIRNASDFTDAEIEKYLNEKSADEGAS